MATGPRSLLLRSLMWVFLMLTLVTALLEAGAWSRTETFNGPFPSHPEFPGVHVLKLGTGLPQCCLITGGDTLDDQHVSTAILTLGGQLVSPAHQQPRQIAIKTQGFGHWDDKIHLFLPDGTANTAATVARITYRVLPRHVQPAEPAALALLLALFLYGPRMSAPLASRLAPLPAMAGLFLGIALLAAVTAYGASVLVAAFSDAALPSADPFQHHSWAKALAHLERSTSYVLLLLAALGALAGHVARRRGIPTQSIEDAEGRLLRFLGIFGLPIALALGVICVSAPWAGMPLTGEISPATVAGFIPLSDAGGYLADAYNIQNLGHWSDFSARRSVAAALRTFTLMAAGNSQTGMLLLQAIMVALALFLASVAVARWRGLWAGVGFFAICYGIIRGYLSTSLTEPLGFFWALLAVPFLIGSVRRQSLMLGIAGLFLMTLALLTRMGAMFAIPAIALWLVLHFGNGWSGRARIACLAAVAVLLPAVFNVMLQTTFAKEGAQIGSNFSYTICGLSVGSNWTGCLGLYQKEKAIAADTSEEDFLYRTAIENIVARPHVIAGRLALGAAAFAARLPGLLVGGIDRTAPPGWFPTVAIIVVAIWTLFVSRRREWEPGELLFWALLILGTLASAGFVWFDAGRRVMITVYPLMALPLAGCLGGVKPQPRKATNTTLIPVGALAAVALLAAIIAPVWANSVAAGRSAFFPQVKDTAIIAGGRQLSGFIVVPDGAPLPAEVPAIHESRFRKIAFAGYLEDQQPLVTPPVTTLPFALVIAPRLEADTTSGQRYIVPPVVLLRPQVQAWRLQLEPVGPGQKDYWRKAVTAVPVERSR